MEIKSNEKNIQETKKLISFFNTKDQKIIIAKNLISSSVFIVALLFLISIGRVVSFLLGSERDFMPNEVPLNIRLSSILIAISQTIFFGYGLYLFNKIKSDKKNLSFDKNQDVRKKWRGLFKAFLISLVVLVVGIIIGLDRGSKYFEIEIKATLPVVILGIYVLQLILGFNRPVLIFSRIQIFINKFLLISFSVLITLIFAYIIKPNFTENLYLISAAIFLGIAVHFLLYVKHGSKFSHYQRLIMRYSDIEKLSFAMAQIDLNVNAEKRALMDIEKKIKKKDYTYLIKYNEQLSKRIVRKESNLLLISRYLVVAILTFILTSVGEGLVQDLFNDQIKIQLCNIFGWYCD